MHAPTSLSDTQPADAPTSATPRFTRQNVLQVLSGVLLCMLLSAIDQNVVVPAVPAIARDLNSYGHLSWIVSAYLVTSTAATPIYGKLSDLYGRRALMLPAIVLFVFASVLCGLARSLPQLVAFRALQGVGGAGLLAMAQASIADVVAPRERGRYQAYISGVWAAASIAGPVLGGWITDAFSWRWIFFVNVPIGAAAFVLSYRALRLLKARRLQARIDYLGAALLTVTITCPLLILSWGGESVPWLSWQVAALCGVTALALAALCVQERHAPEPLMPPRLVMNPVASLGVLEGFLATACIFAAAFLLPLQFQLLRGASASDSGSLIVPFLGGVITGAFLAGQATPYIGRCKALILCGFASGTVGFLLLAWQGAGTSYVAVVIFMAIAGGGIGLCQPTSLVAVQNAAQPRDVGTATSALLFLRSMGGAFGSTLGGSLLAGRFAQVLAAGGEHQGLTLGALSANAGTMHLDAATRGLAQSALESGFFLAFLACAGLAAIGFVVCLPMRDLPLRK